MGLQIGSGTRSAPATGGGGLQIGGYRSAVSSRGGAVRLTSPSNWLGSGDGTNLPSPQSPQEQRISNSFKSLPGQARLDTLAKLQTQAKAGNADSARKLQYLGPQATENVPSEKNFGSTLTNIEAGVANAVGGTAKKLFTPAAKINNDISATRAASQVLDRAVSYLPVGYKAALLPSDTASNNAEAQARTALQLNPNLPNQRVTKGQQIQENLNPVIAAAFPGVAKGLLTGAGKVIGELRAPNQIAKLTNELTNSTAGGKLANLQSLLGEYQKAYDQSFGPKQLPAGEAKTTLGLPANTSVPYPSSRVPGGAVMINPENPAAKVIANAGKPGAIPTNVALRDATPNKMVGILDRTNSRMVNGEIIPGRPEGFEVGRGQNITDVTAKPVSQEKLVAAGRALVDEKTPTAPTVKPTAPLEDLKSQLASVRANGSKTVSETKLLNDIIQHPDASMADKQLAIAERHNLVHNEAKDSLANDTAAKTGMTPTQSHDLLAQGKGEHGSLYQAISDHQAEGMPRPVAYDYNPGKSTGPSEADQMAGIHKYLGQINKALTDGTSRSQKEVDYLTSERAKAEDVLAGRKTFAETYSTGMGGPGRSRDELLAEAAKSAGSASKANGMLKEARDLINPALGTEGTKVKNLLRARVGDLEFKKAQMSVGTEGDVKAWAKMKPIDHLTFIHNMEIGAKQPTHALDVKAAALKDWFNQDYELASSLKEDLPYIKNYFTHNGLWQDAKAADRFYETWMKPTLGGKPGALEHRSFPTILDGIEHGLKVRDSNPQVLANFNRASLLRAKMAQDFTAQAEADGVSPHTTQRILDRYLDRGFKDSSIYQSARQVSNTLNQAQLSLSGFHVTGTAINSVISQFSNGLNDILKLHPIRGGAKIVTSPTAPIRNILQGDKMLKDFRAGKTTTDMKNIVEGGGRIGQPVSYKATSLSKTLEDLQSGSVKTAAKGIAAAPLRALSTAAKPVMEWWVPRIKLGASKDLINSNLSTLPKDASADQILAAKAKAIDSIDNRFGQLIKDNLFWEEHIKDINHILMRSPGWNIGTVRELGGGVIDLLKPQTYKDLATGKGVSDRAAYTLSLAAGIALMGGTTQYLFTGTWPKSVEDYYYPRTGRIDKNGNPERVSLPTYTKDIFAFIHNPVETVLNKANPLLTEALYVGRNRDYFGNEIVNPEDNAKTKAGQLGGYLLKANLPFSLTNSSQRVQNNTASKVETFMGVNPAPAYITKSPFEQRVQEALNLKLGNTTKTPEQAALTTAKTKAKETAQQGDTSAVDQMVSQGLITKRQGDNLKAESKGSSLQNTFSYLLSVDRPAAARVLKDASPADIRQLGDLNATRSLMYKALRSNNVLPSTKTASQQILDKIGR